MYHNSIVLKRLYRWGNNGGSLWMGMKLLQQIASDIELKVETNQVIIVPGNWLLFWECHEAAKEGEDTYLPSTVCENRIRK